SDLLRLDESSLHAFASTLANAPGARLQPSLAVDENFDLAARLDQLTTNWSRQGEAFCAWVNDNAWKPNKLPWRSRARHLETLSRWFGGHPVPSKDLSAAFDYLTPARFNDSALREGVSLAAHPFLDELNTFFDAALA